MTGTAATVTRSAQPATADGSGGRTARTAPVTHGAGAPSDGTAADRTVVDGVPRYRADGSAVPRYRAGGCVAARYGTGGGAAARFRTAVDGEVR